MVIIVKRDHLLNSCKQRLPKYGEDKTYVLAAALDPRQKLEAFSRNRRVFYNDYLKLPDEEMVRTLISKELLSPEFVRSTPHNEPVLESQVTGEMSVEENDIFIYGGQWRNSIP